ncbi:MAG: MarR family transcriptional regulator [Rhizobiaceae bacterium]|nr:MarR family transcriptional regulator [Rhizobiaceae bacterium]
MAHSFGNSLRHVNRLIQRDLGTRIAPLGITLGQWYALRTLWHYDGLTQVELAQKSGIAGPAMVIAIRALLAMGLVTRRRHASDKRKYIISLTEKGRRLEEPALKAAIEANSDALQGITPSDIEIAMQVLAKAYDNLTAVGIPVALEDGIDALIE